MPGYKAVVYSKNSISSTESFITNVQALAGDFWAIYFYTDININLSVKDSTGLESTQGVYLNGRDVVVKPESPQEY